MKIRHLILLSILVPACLDLVFDADLEGPVVVDSDLRGPRTLEVPVRAGLILRFSEPLDGDRVHIALIAWPTVGSCALTPACDEGTCERGRCQTDPIADADLRALADGEALDASTPFDHVLRDTEDGPATEVRVTPRLPLAPHARHTLLVFARDHRGAPLVDEVGEAAVWRRDFVTAGPGTSGPEAQLTSPPPGADLVPTDLARVETAFPRPVVADASAVLTLRGDDGAALDLLAPEPCPGWVPGLCLSWRPAAELAPGVVYRLGGGTLRDRAGRPAIEPAEPAAFRTGPGPDPSPPDLSHLSVELLGRCLHARLLAREPLRVRLSAGGGARELVAPAGPVDLGLPLAGPPGAAIAARVQAWDLSGRLAERDSEHVLGASFDPAAPPLAVTEVLANPRGPEPRQEYVELVDVRAAGGPLALTGLRLVDGPAGALDLGAGDPLPAFTSAPGQRHLVVAGGYDPHEGSDPAPPPGASLVRVDASLAAGGLKNGPGEAIALVWEAGPQGPVLIDSYGGWLDPGDLPGRSALKGAGACDAPDDWRPHPEGVASPALPP